MRNKYDQAQDQGMPIVERVLEVAEHHGVPMTQVAVCDRIKVFTVGTCS